MEFPGKFFGMVVSVFCIGRMRFVVKAEADNYDGNGCIEMSCFDAGRAALHDFFSELIEMSFYFFLQLGILLRDFDNDPVPLDISRADLNMKIAVVFFEFDKPHEAFEDIQGIFR